MSTPPAGPVATDPHVSPIAVSVSVRFDRHVAPLKPVWRFFGADEPNYSYMRDGRSLLADLGRLSPGNVYFRAHNLLTTGDGTPALKWGSTNAYTEDADGNPVYDWTLTDRIFDTCLARGVRPLAQIGFMPKHLSTQPDPYQHAWHPKVRYEEIMTGWCFPPKSYDRWRELCFRWVAHCVERYGKAEVEQWYWETWNEANGHYWRATPEEWYKLNDYAIDGVRRALPTARVGGPHSAGSGADFTRNFLQHCLHGRNHATGTTGTPLDFFAFHAKGWPTFKDGHVRMGIANQLRSIDEGFAMLASFPQIRHLPIIIGESDPDGCAACQGPQLGYRNGTVYSSYTAASFARKHLLADRHGVDLQGALTWAFEFEDQPYFAGFRVLASNGIPLPVLNVFRMFALMSGQRVATTSTSEIPLDEMLADGVRVGPDVSAFAAIDESAGRATVMLWHYHDDDLPGPAADTHVTLTGLPESWRSLRLTTYRVDDRHSNAFAEWKRLGSPQSPTPAQYAHLAAVGELARAGAPVTVTAHDRTVTLPVSLARHDAALLVIERA